MLPRCTRHYCIFATLLPRSDISYIYIYYIAVFFLTTVSCVHVIMDDRLDLILHDLLLLQAQQAQLDVEDALLLVRRRRRKRQRRPKAFWMRPWLQAERRLLYGHYDRLMTELRREDQQSFFNFLRMPAEMFDELINRVGPRIQRLSVPGAGHTRVSEVILGA